MKHCSPLSDFLPELLPCRQTIIRSYTVFVTAFAMFLLSITLKPIVFQQLFPQGYFLIMLEHRKALAVCGRGTNAEEKLIAPSKVFVHLIIGLHLSLSKP